jgi:uncharacterized OB-fold protein
VNAETPLLPDVNDTLAAPHWRGLLSDRLLVQRCTACGYLRWPPSPVCPECLTPGGEWSPMSGRGRLWSYCVYWHAYHPSLRSDIPYVVGLVELDEGPRVVARLEVDSGPPLIDGVVEAAFVRLSADIAMLRFRPVHRGEREGRP